jgi:hypothetical protein
MMEMLVLLMVVILQTDVLIKEYVVTMITTVLKTLVMLFQDVSTMKLLVMMMMNVLKISVFPNPDAITLL